jgi:hypothetical protein
MRNFTAGKVRSANNCFGGSVTLSRDPELTLIIMTKTLTTCHLGPQGL